MIIVSPSILGADFTNLGNEIRSVSNAQMLHIDVMDGCFVPNISIGLPVIKSINQFCDMYLDVHLMIQNPIAYVEEFANSGADIICFHIECDSNISDTIKAIKACGKKVGISLKPNTPVSQLIPYLKEIDMALVMTVEPGFGGQSFMPDMIGKIQEIRSYATHHHLPLDIQVDGGINLQTGKRCVDAGANVLVAGAFLFQSEDPNDLVEQLKQL